MRVAELTRRKFFALADIAANAKRGKNATLISPTALEAVKRTDGLFDIEREINRVAAYQIGQSGGVVTLGYEDACGLWRQIVVAAAGKNDPATVAHVIFAPPPASIRA